VTKYTNKELNALIDRLTLYLAEYTRMFANKEFDSPRYKECKEIISGIHSDIQKNKALQAEMDEAMQASPQINP
jgi:hypothetical protein